MRTDIHRPSAINPTEYEFVALENIKIEGLGECYQIASQRETLRAHMDHTGGRWSTHEHGGNCHVCGAHCIWTVIFYHGQTNTYIRTGSDCAEKLGMAFDGDELDAFKRSAATAEKNRAGKAKAKLMLETAGLGRAWEIHLETESMDTARRVFADNVHVKQQESSIETEAVLWWNQPDCPAEPSKDRRTLGDMVSKMIAWGDSWTDRQKGFAAILIDRIDNEARIAAERAAEAAAADPVPVTDERIQVEGIVLSTKTVDTAFGRVTKALIKTDAGWKVFGKAPVVGLQRGNRVRFMARIEPSNDDPKFGFFSRPTKGEVCEC